VTAGPQRLGPYRLVEKIGEGGMGVVHLGVAPDGDLVAVKVLRPWLVAGQDGRARFEREIATLRRVGGPRVAEVVDADSSHDPPYVVTRYVRGSSLDKVIDDHGPFRTKALRKLAAGLAEALASVHAAGVVHRDIKPGNVIMTDDGPVLIDFGLARAVDEARLTATGLVIGTPGYLAPEVVAGKPPEPATDIHGWAATVAFAGTGKPPYGTGPDVVVLDRIRRGEADLGDIDAELATLLRRALSPDQAQRPSTGEVQQAFSASATDAATVIVPPVAPPVVPPVEQAPVVPPPVPPLPPVEPANKSEDETTHVNADPPTVIATPTRVQPSPAPSPGPPPVRAPGPEPARAPGRVSGQGAEQYPRQPASVPAGPGPNGMAPPLTTWPARLAVAAAGLTLLILLGAAPLAGVIVLFAGLVVARVTWRTRRNLYERRVARGYQPRDQLVAAVGAPWYVLVAAVPSALQATLLSMCGLLVGAAVNVTDAAGIRMPFLAGGAIMLALAWFGPATARVRHGVRALAAPLERNSRAAWIAVGVFVAISWILLLIWESYGSVWPPVELPGNPLSQLFE
jgi:serine/threonine protein kinase